MLCLTANTDCCDIYCGAGISGEDSTHMGKCLNQHERWFWGWHHIWLGVGNVRFHKTNSHINLTCGIDDRNASFPCIWEQLDRAKVIMLLREDICGWWRMCLFFPSANFWSSAMWAGMVMPQHQLYMMYNIFWSRTLCFRCILASWFPQLLNSHNCLWTGK